ncbi:MAG: hypothetical protein SPF69_01500 [Candidatus Ornithospirochaeta sp.]|nr:hypothetical protein [Sphaerochaetaceae bacterium]MDY5522745.1 hypothetical protein [Candidatus Ornithospirochaeta sp.]
MKKKRVFLEKLTASVLILSMLASCTPSLSGPSEDRREKMVSQGARVIDEEYDFVRGVLIETEEFSEEDFASYGILDGETVVRGLLEGGDEDLLSFLCATSDGGVDGVLSTAKSLLPEKEYGELEKKAKEIEERAGAWGDRVSRSLAPAQKDEFYKDLKSMVVKTVVLLTASIVYAMIPKVMFWGKVSAAAAVSVAAGVVASGFVSMVEWSDEDLKNTDKDFSAWLEEITVEPFTDWALAQGVLNAQMAATNNPVTSALVLGVFALYHIGEDAKTLMKKYNWEV